MEATWGHVSFALKLRRDAMSPTHPILCIKEPKHFFKSIGEGVEFISMSGSQKNLGEGCLSQGTCRGALGCSHSS